MANNILQGSNKDKLTLFLPVDLHSWEESLIIKTIDINTYTINHPEKKELAYQKMINFGQTLILAAISLAKIKDKLIIKGSKFGQNYEDILDQMQHLSDEIVDSFYHYGQACINHSYPTEKLSTEQIKQFNLSHEEQEKADRFFLNGFENRQDPGKYKKEIEKEKRILEKRSNLQIKENLTPAQLENFRIQKASSWLRWLIREDLLMEDIQEKNQRQITYAIETPTRERNTSIFRRGQENFIRNLGFDKLLDILADLETKNANYPDKMKKTDKFNLKYLRDFKSIIEEWHNLDYKTLYEALDIDNMRQELEIIRATKNIKKISSKELKIAKKIQKAISHFPYKEVINNPLLIMEQQSLNCAGSLIAATFLEELGIKCLYTVDKGWHAATILITCNQKSYWQDLTPSTYNRVGNYTEIKPDMISGGSIQDFLQNPCDNF